MEQRADPVRITPLHTEGASAAVVFVHGFGSSGQPFGRLPELMAEERAMFERSDQPFPKAVMDTLQAVRARTPLDYFGMDFGLMPDGRVVLFEANATMNFFPFLPDPR